MDQRPKYKTRNHKTPKKKNIGRTLFDINCGNNFFDQTPKAKEKKAKLN